MFEMRVAGEGDRDGIAAMIRRRDAWLSARGWPGFGDGGEALAAQAGDVDFPVWVLVRDQEVMGCTTLFGEVPEWCFTEDERSEPAVFMASTVTAPSEGLRLGSLIAFWALDHAAETGRRWVGRATFEAPLMRYYRDVQGWDLLRELDRRGRSAFIMARRAERRPELAKLFETTSFALGVR
ncbi:hypothetical protein AB0L06_43240 [Spirillospora sp. NPDC052269]